MKRLFFILCISTAAVGTLAGCATTASQSNPSANRVGQQIDSNYVRSVEKQAGRTGTKVYWINPPRDKNQVGSKSN